MRDHRLTLEAEATGLTKKDQAEVLNMITKESFRMRVFASHRGHFVKPASA
jgi:hypothetical protein